MIRRAIYDASAAAIGIPLGLLIGAISVALARVRG